MGPCDRTEACVDLQRGFIYEHERAGKSFLERSCAVECFIVPGCGGTLASWHLHYKDAKP
jgi:hypothetical protein